MQIVNKTVLCLKAILGPKLLKHFVSYFRAVNAIWDRNQSNLNNIQQCIYYRRTYIYTLSLFHLNHFLSLSISFSLYVACLSCKAVLSPLAGIFYQSGQGDRLAPVFWWHGQVHQRYLHTNLWIHLTLKMPCLQLFTAQCSLSLSLRTLSVWGSAAGTESLVKKYGGVTPHLLRPSHQRSAGYMSLTQNYNSNYISIFYFCLQSINNYLKLLPSKKARLISSGSGPAVSVPTAQLTSSHSVDSTISEG